MTTPTTSPTTALARASDSMRHSANHKPRLPREVWPLLGTIGTTELVAAGAILWFSAPTVAPVAITGLGLGAASVSMLALVLRLVGRLTAPRPARGAGHHSA